MPLICSSQVGTRAVWLCGCVQMLKLATLDTKTPPLLGSPGGLRMYRDVMYPPSPRSACALALRPSRPRVAFRFQYVVLNSATCDAILTAWPPATTEAAEAGRVTGAEHASVSVAHARQTAVHHPRQRRPEDPRPSRADVVEVDALATSRTPHMMLFSHWPTPLTLAYASRRIAG